MTKEQEQIHNKAWDLLGKKGLKLGEKMMVRSSFVTASGYKEEHPFIETKYKDGEIEYYHSTFDLISNMMFETENEVILANAIYLNMDEECCKRDFREILKFTFRIMGVNSKWA